MNYILYLLTLIVIYSILVLTMNLLMGYLGILYLAHPAIYGIGAYTFAYLAMRGTGFFPSLLASGIAAAVAGFILSLPSLKLKSHYIGMTTLGFLMIANGLFMNVKSLTRGALGVPGIPRPEIFGYTFNDGASFLALTFIIALIIGAILYRVVHSPFGKTIEAIREDETAAKTLGKNIIKYKIQVFLITSFFGGIGGALLATFLGFINPWNFALEELIILLAMVVIGGMASFWGSIAGAVIIVLFPEIIRFINLPAGTEGPLRYAIYGVLIILFMIYKPNGLFGRRTNIFSK